MAGHTQFSPNQANVFKTSFDCSKSSTLSTVAKQHQFRKQLKLPVENPPEQHQLVLIESSGNDPS